MKKGNSNLSKNEPENIPKYPKYTYLQRRLKIEN